MDENSEFEVVEGKGWATTGKRVYDLDEVKGLCTTRDPEQEYGLIDSYIDEMWFDPNLMMRRKVFTDKLNGNILGFAVYETRATNVTKSGIRLLEYELHLICVKGMVEKSTTPPHIGIFKYMLADTVLDLMSAARREGAEEARLKIKAVKTAYPMWWYMGFRHPANANHRTYSERSISDDGRPMYLWIMDPSGKEKHDWRLVDKKQAWINGDDNVTERMRDRGDYRPSNPKSFFDYVANEENTAAKTFPNYNYDPDYKINDLD
tara:strand:- start:1121 stop:1909 length:789 start_codon:yes stop_codon:yes gene_type:complete